MGLEEYLLDRAEKNGIKKGREEGIEKGRLEGIKIGIVEGMERGIALGTEQKEREIIRNMLFKGEFSVDQIAELVGVPVAFVKRIEKEMALVR